MYTQYDFLTKTIGGWCEDYPIASGEDADLCYRVWSNNYDIIIDERILIKHEGKVTTKSKIKNWKKLWKKNGSLFRRKWAFYYFFTFFARIYMKAKYYKKNTITKKRNYNIQIICLAILIGYIALLGFSPLIRLSRIYNLFFRS